MEKRSQRMERILDLIYPPALYCVCCGNYIDETRVYHLCDHCLSHIRWDGDPAREIRGMRTLRCCEYDIYSRSIIFSLKYKGRKYIAREVAEIMRDRLMQAGGTFDRIVPVPLSERKEKQRGFNQAALIGKHLSALTGAGFLPDALRRIRDTKPMRGLSPSERELNVEGCFAAAEEKELRGSIRGARILLLDDFTTTGATGRACAAELRNAGASDVLFLAFAAKF